MTYKARNTTTAIAGVAGAVVGAGVAVAATKIMTDKKLRDKVGGTINQVKDQVLEALDQNAESSSETQQLKGGQASRGSGKKRGNSQKTGASSRNETQEADAAM